MSDKSISNVLTGSFSTSLDPCKQCKKAVVGFSNSKDLCNCINTISSEPKEETITFTYEKKQQNIEDLGLVPSDTATTPMEQTEAVIVPRKLSQIQKDNEKLINEALDIALQTAKESNEKDKALKFDTNKIPVELLPTQALEEVAKVLAFGAKKYASWNWAKGFKWMRLIGAAIRHLYAYQRGEDKDPESGLSHLAHASCCVLFLLQHEISGLGEDDRYKEFIKKGEKSE